MENNKDNYQMIINDNIYELNSFYNINDKNIEDKEKILKEYDKMITKNEIRIKYKIGKEDKIRIFGDVFVENNISNFQMIIKDKNYKINSFYYIKNEKENDILKIKLKQMKNVTNLSWMFNECFALIELPDISKLDTNKVTSMRCMFSQCSNLSSLPDISK